MNYDDQVLGVGNSSHPANQEEQEYNNLNPYKELSDQLFKDKMDLLKRAMDAEFYLRQIKLLADGMKETNGLATIISNLLKDIE